MQEIDRADVWSAKALPLVLAKNYAEALKCYDKAIELAPNNVEYKEYREDCLKQLQNKQEMEKY